jgi:hypothetical protein
MSQCSFLSTSENKIDCFGECAFYSCEEISEGCPFKNLTGNRFSKVKSLFSYDLFEEDSVDVKGIDHYYIKTEFV